MFKKLSSLEKAMRSILKSIKSSDDNSIIFDNFSIDDANAFHICLNRKYIENVDEMQNANGNYHYTSLGNTYVNDKGLEFIQNTSLRFRIKTAIFDILKGTLGFILGILSTIIAEVIVFLITHPEEVEKFLHGNG